jgi:hypothetical protein
LEPAVTFQPPVRDEDFLTPPVTSLFALKGGRVAILVLPALFGTYGVAKAVVHRSYGG